MTTLVLAAGVSQRFGAAHKLLAPTGSEPLAAVTVRHVLAATRGPVVLVVGHGAARVIAALKRARLCTPRLRPVYNPRYRDGLAASLACGLRAAPRIGRAITIHLADVPHVDHRLIDRLRDEINRGRTFARAAHAGRPGHPVRVRRDMVSRAMCCDNGETGLRDLLAALPESARAYIEGGRRCRMDVDTRAAHRRIAR